MTSYNKPVVVASGTVAETTLGSTKFNMNLEAPSTSPSPYVKI